MRRLLAEHLPAIFGDRPDELEAAYSTARVEAETSSLVTVMMPGETLEYPLQIQGDPTGLTYTWVRLGDSVAVAPPNTLHKFRSMASPPTSSTA